MKSHRDALTSGGMAQVRYHPDNGILSWPRSGDNSPGAVFFTKALAKGEHLTL
jgi:hypothetical protein